MQVEIRQAIRNAERLGMDLVDMHPRSKLTRIEMEYIIARVVDKVKLDLLRSGILEELGE